jgi:hypothetical protein
VFSAWIAWTEMEAGMEEISKEQLSAIRWLSDEQLIRFVTEVSQYGWVKASEYLRQIMKDKGVRP